MQRYQCSSNKSEIPKHAKIILLGGVSLSGWLTLELTEPVRLAIVFTGQDCRVEEDEDDNEPVEGLWLDRLATRSPCPPVDSADTRQSQPLLIFNSEQLSLPVLRINIFDKVFLAMDDTDKYQFLH